MKYLNANILKSLLAAWVMLVFGTSTLLFFLSPLQFEIHNENRIINTLRSIWEIADEVGPLVKISLIVVFSILVLPFTSRLYDRKIYLYALGILAGIASTVSVLMLLPENYSRGFGIGLTGQRLDLAVLPFYLIGAIGAGIAYALTFFKLAEGRKSE